MLEGGPQKSPIISEGLPIPSTGKCISISTNFAIKIKPNVGKYTIHWYRLYNSDLLRGEISPQGNPFLFLWPFL